MGAGTYDVAIKKKPARADEAGSGERIISRTHRQRRRALGVVVLRERNLAGACSVGDDETTVRFVLGRVGSRSSSHSWAG